VTNKSATKVATKTSSWATFKPQPGGSANDIRRNAAAIKTRVNEEKKIFGQASIINGGQREKTV
jgi:hypothetical protein